MFFKDKIRVEIIGPGGMHAKNFVIEENTVIIRKGRKGAGGAAYKPEFTRDCLIEYKTGIWPFRKIRKKLMLFDGGDNCISFKVDQKNVDIPIWNRTASEKLHDASMIKKAGTSFQKVQINPLVYVLVAINVVLTIVSIAVGSGRMRFV